MPDNERIVRDFVAAWSRLDSQGTLDLPCLGVIEMRDGRIGELRNYFDLNTLMQAIRR